MVLAGSEVGGLYGMGVFASTMWWEIARAVDDMRDGEKGRRLELRAARGRSRATRDVVERSDLMAVPTQRSFPTRDTMSPTCPGSEGGEPAI